jgi:hypothetical protein
VVATETQTETTMYQILCSDRNEICVIGKGENGLAEVRKDNSTRFRGSYQECEDWCRDRGITIGVSDGRTTRAMGQGQG